VTPGLYDRNRITVIGEPFLLIDGILQSQDGVISVKAGRIQALPQGAAAPSHDFH
jgi:error-prone DNA polymerase